MAQYNGWKLFDKVLLIAKEKHSKKPENYQQAYLVDPKDKEQLKRAKSWAEWTEYGPSFKDEEGKWKHEYEIEHKPVEFTFDNEGFEFELLESANGSNQGGKLSFWNCLVSKDNNTFKIGIAADLLLDLLKENDFVKGKCTDKVLFARQSGKVGVVTKNSESYKEAVKDAEWKKAVAKKTVKYGRGDQTVTVSLDQIYVGPIYKWYKFTSDPYYWSTRERRFTLTKLETPIIKHMFLSHYDSLVVDKKLDIDKLDDNWYFCYDINNTKAARSVTGVKVDIPMAFNDWFYNTYNTYESAMKKNSYYYCDIKNPTEKQEELGKVLSLCNYGYFGYTFSDECPEIDPKIMEALKNSGRVDFVGFEEVKND